MDPVNQGFLLGLILAIVSHTVSVSPPELDVIDRDLRVPHETNETTTSNVTVHPTHPPLVLRQRFVTKDGKFWTSKPQNESSVKIEATSLVQEDTMMRAGRTIAGLVKHMPHEIFETTAAARGVRIFPFGHGMTIYPEMAMHANTPECHRSCSGNCHVTCLGGSRKFDGLAGLTGGVSYVSEANIHCKGDGYYGRLNVLAHEFSHLIMFHLPHTWRHKIVVAYGAAKSKGTWTRSSYAMSNQNEYWAESTGAFFRFSHMPPSTSGGLNMCTPTKQCTSVQANRAFLKQKDPQLFAVMDYVYTDNHPELNEGISTCIPQQHASSG